MGSLLQVPGVHTNCDEVVQQDQSRDDTKMMRRMLDMMVQMPFDMPMEGDETFDNIHVVALEQSEVNKILLHD